MQPDKELVFVASPPRWRARSVPLATSSPGGSATRCRCGHEFAASTIVKRPTTKRCPGCQREQPRLLEVCGCGHEFADVRELREALEERARIGWSYVALGATALLVCTGIMIATSGMWLIGVFGGVMLVVRGFVTRADARAQLRDVRAEAGMLPGARVVRQGTDTGNAAPDGELSPAGAPPPRPTRRRARRR